MKRLLQLEELGQFLLGLYFFNQTPHSWWWFLALILLPDLSMLGYVLNPKTGAWLYNVFHHKGIGIIAFCIGAFWGIEWLHLSGIILFTHSAMDRLFGYGLKHETSFNDTHLGKIGNKK